MWSWNPLAMCCKKKNMNRFYIALYMLLISFLTHRYMLCCLSVIFKNSCKLWQNHQAVNSEGKNPELRVYGKILIWLLYVYALSESLQLCDRFFPFSLTLPFSLLYWTNLLNELLFSLLCYLFSMWSKALFKYRSEYRITSSLLNSSAGAAL